MNATGGLDMAYLFGDQHIDPQWWVVHVGAGGSHSAEDVTRLLDYAGKYEPDITIGSASWSGALRRPPVPQAVFPSRRDGDEPCDPAEDPGLDVRSRGYSPHASRDPPSRVPVLRSCLADRSPRTVSERGLSVAEVPITYRAGVSHMNAHQSMGGMATVVAPPCDSVVIGRSSGMRPTISTATSRRSTSSNGSMT